MAFIVVEWQEGGLSVVNKSWLTPMKKESFWPPVKEQHLFTKEIKQKEPNIDSKWKLHSVKRCMFQTDDYDKAFQKCKQAEDTSNLDSDSSEYRKPRKRVPSKRIYSSDEDDIDESFPKKQSSSALKTLERPPKLNIKSLLKSNQNLTKATQRVATEENFDREQVSLHSSFEQSKLLEDITDFGEDILGAGSSTRNTPKSTRSEQFQEQKFLVETPRTELFSSFEKKVIHLLTVIKNQNFEIIKKLNVNSLGPLMTLPDLPVQIPIQSLDGLNILESFFKDSGYSALSAYLSTLGGRDIASKTNRVLKSLILDELACQFSFCGNRNNKKAFSDLLLRKCVISAVKLGVPNVTEKAIEDAIKVWLKHAPQRLKTKLNIILGLPNINQRLFKIRSLINRKQNMVLHSKKNNLHSVFTISRDAAILPTRTANWGLDYDRPVTFKTAPFAFNCLLQVLGLC